MKGFLHRWWPLLVWAGLIALASSTFISSKQFVRGFVDYTPWDLTEEQFSVFWQQWWWVFVKGFHFLEFSVLFLLLQVTLRKARVSPTVALAIAYFGCAGYAVVDEWHQSYVPKRGGRVTDVLIDLSGVSLLAVSLIVRNRRRESNEGKADAID